ncbi:MAG: ribosome biogenesis GTPase YlqF [Gammaproteobacteria bacterium]|nr:ribosome biogenesis GTPase YlqF [Gammaproteobacteria bacterium]MYE29220.1 ribosome biogenesis GTPase YlqF [Gammaproteobacteria bacterium]
MPISWYPGHMHKARRELGSLLRGARIVIEVLDARIPAASSNPLLASMRGNLPLIRVLNKCDLADDGLTAAWQTHFAGLQDGACLSNGRDSPLDRNRLLEQIRHLAGASPGGKAGKPGRIAIVGIPNVGKSSLMNWCIDRKLARTGNTPSVTREQQFTRFAGDWTMVDTPGMLRPKLEDQHAAFLMASIGSIGAAAADTMEVAGFLAGLLLERHRERLEDRYGLETSDATPGKLFDRIAVSRGALKKAGLADPEKAAEILLNDFRAARLGKITLEYPLDSESGQA